MKEKFSYVTRAANEPYTHVRPDGLHVTVIYFKDMPKHARADIPWTAAKHMPDWAQRKNAVNPPGRLKCDICGYIDRTELKTAVKKRPDGVIRCQHCQRRWVEA